MKTIFAASRIKDSTLSYTVLLRTAGVGSVDVSLWLNDDEARALGQQLLAASEPTVPATPTPEAA
jgi:hypothetical protein